jgi:2-hydroxychromene-2-carboxylate isomerase
VSGLSRIDVRRQTAVLADEAGLLAAGAVVTELQFVLSRRTPMSQQMKLYFSFRSPYSWLGCVRARQVLPPLGVTIRYIPIFPPPGTEPAVSASQTRIDYLVEDVERFAAAYGIEVSWPENADTDWVRPHACWVYAEDEGRGPEFLAAAYEARFGRGLQLGSDEVLGAAGVEAGLDADAVVAAADDEALHQRVWRGMAEARDDRVFGVPFFVVDGARFWGNDRLDWVVRAVQEARGEAVPDLSADRFAVAFARGE